MTLDEAIAHCLEVADKNEISAITYKNCKEIKTNMYESYSQKKSENDCRECAAEHRQLAEWLTDYKELKNSIGAVELSNMKEALALIRTLKAGLNGWKEDPFGIIAEVCRAVTDCRRCQWYEKCPFSNNYESYPEEWRD